MRRWFVVMRVAASMVATLLLLSLSDSAHAQIAAARRIDWTQAGIPGGIPNRTTICSTLTPGATFTQINTALTGCSNGVVQLNAGTYNLAGGITFSGVSNVTLRGAGPEQTILKFTASNGCGGFDANICVRGSSSVWSGAVPAGQLRNWTAGYAKGTTQITLDSTSGLTVGTVLILDQLDDTTDTGGLIVSDLTGTFSLEGGAPGRANRAQQQFVQVTAITGTQVTIAPGLYMPNWRASQQPQAWWWGTPSATGTMIGVENLTLDHTSSNEQAGITFFNAYKGWVKNVKSLKSQRNHIWLNQAARIEVRDSYFYGTKSAASQSYGVESFTTSDALVINNMFQHVTVPLMTGSNHGSVFAYNYATDMHYTVVANWMQTSFVGGHDAGTGMNLFEGNVGNQFLMDLYHGTGNLATVFRNYLTGRDGAKTQNTSVVNIWGFNRRLNLVGNVLGTAGYHTKYETSQVAPGSSGSSDQAVYLLGYTGTGEKTTLGYDALAVTTLLRWGNYDSATQTVRWNSAEVPADNPSPTQNLPASLFLAAKPGWWGTGTWPPIGPEVTGGADPAGKAHKIPAQRCYETSPKNPDGTLIFTPGSCYTSSTLILPCPPVSLNVAERPVLAGLLE